MDRYELLAVVIIAVAAIPVVVVIGIVVRSVYREWANIKADASAHLVGYSESIGLSPHQATSIAHDVLKNNSEFEIRSSPASKHASELSPSIRNFFQDYPKVILTTDDVAISVGDVCRYAHDGQFLLLGSDGEHTHLVARPNDDRVYVVADDVPKESQIEGEFPTIYHWIVWVNKRGELTQVADE
jgi:hypothetical protein